MLSLEFPLLWLFRVSMYYIVILVRGQYLFFKFMESLSYCRKSLVRNELRRRGGPRRPKCLNGKGLGQNLRQYRDGFRHRPRKRKGKQKDSHN